MTPLKRTMTPGAFRAFIREMIETNLALNQTDVGRKLEISPDTLARYRIHGAPKPIALACAALVHRLKPYEFDAARLRRNR